MKSLKLPVGWCLWFLKICARFGFKNFKFLSSIFNFSLLIFNLNRFA